MALDLSSTNHRILQSNGGDLLAAGDLHAEITSKAYQNSSQPVDGSKSLVLSELSANSGAALGYGK